MIWIEKTKKNKPPTLGEVARLLGGTRGFLGRRGDGEAGIKAVWEGPLNLLHYLAASEVLKGLGSYG